MSSNNFTYGRLVKTEWLVTNVTAIGSPCRAECAILKIEWLVTDAPVIGSPDRAERAILGDILAGCVFGQIQDILVVGEPLCDVGTSS